MLCFQFMSTMHRCFSCPAARLFADRRTIHVLRRRLICPLPRRRNHMPQVFLPAYLLPRTPRVSPTAYLPPRTPNHMPRVSPTVCPPLRTLSHMPQRAPPRCSIPINWKVPCLFTSLCVCVFCFCPFDNFILTRRIAGKKYAPIRALVTLRLELCSFAHF